MTFISYPNLTATSENGRFRVEITGTPTDDYFRDQGTFVYRLYANNQPVWEWQVSKSRKGSAGLDDYPHEAWVSDGGWVVVRTHEWFRAGILVLSPSGQVVLRRLHRHVIEQDGPGFLDGEPSEYLGDSSAGPFWARAAIAYFVEHLGRPHWCIRTWWGRRVVIDLMKAEISPSVLLDENLAQSQENAWVQKALTTNIARLESEGEQLCARTTKGDRTYWSVASPVQAAAYQAGWLKSAEAVPFLRRLESCRISGSTTYVGWAAVHMLCFRQLAKLSLLRLEEEPRWLSQYQFELRAKTPNNFGEQCGETFEFPAQVAARDPNLLEPGLTQKETLRRIGAPDFIGREWEYDFFTRGKGLTVRIIWDESHLKGLPHERYRVLAVESPPRIARVESVEPQWKRITRRDYEVVR